MGKSIHDRCEELLQIRGSQTHPMRLVGAPQDINEGPTNVDVIKSQTAESHSYSRGPGSTHIANNTN